MRIHGVMSTSTTKPVKKKKDGEIADDSYIAITMKFDLEQFSDPELGGLLLTLARGETVAISIDSFGVVEEEEEEDDEQGNQQSIFAVPGVVPVDPVEDRK